MTYVIEYSTELKYDSLFNRGSIFYELAQYDKALSDFLYAIKLNPQHAYTYTMAGNCYSYQKNYKKAIQYYEQALENVINNTEYYFDEDIKKIQNVISIFK